MMISKKVVVIGAGAAGLMAGATAALYGASVTIIEKNKRVGRKIMITGKGRCNLANNCDEQTFINNVPVNGRFLYSAINAFTPEDTIEFFESKGLKTKTERGNRVFPASDKSVDVVDTMHDYAVESGCKIVCDTANALILEDGAVIGVKCEENTYYADSVIICCGGKSYPLTGSTGDGYTLAKQAGHTIVPLKPSLVPFTSGDKQCKDMQGLALKNVALRIVDKNSKKTVYSDFGEMLFTHFGVSGPLILSASAVIKQNTIKKPLQMFIDLKPALSYEALDKRILREFDDAKNKQFKNSINKLLPSKMIPVIIGLSGIDPDKKVNEISKGEREGLVNLLKKLPVTLNGTRQWNEAIVTKGGISTKDINPSTMESKIIKNLYFAGEVLDLDALTGGYNLQIAWSTGALAGKSINKEE